MSPRYKSENKQSPIGVSGWEGDELNGKTGDGCQRSTFGRGEIPAGADGRRKGGEITSRTSRISVSQGFGLCTVDTRG